MYLYEIKPGAALDSFVRVYRIIDFNFPHNNPIPPKAYTPRPEQCLQFFPTPTIIATEGNGTKIIAPKNALFVGQHTSINHRTVFKKFLSLQIVFQPGALHRLLGIPMAEFTNQLIEAEDVIGNQIEAVNDQLFHAKDHQEMTRIAEEFLLRLVNKVKIEQLPIDRIAGQMLKLQQSLDWYINNSFLCHRQFDRKFADRTGISPKEYLRVIRFDQAYLMKNRFPNLSWFNVAIACGYYDYQHLSKDYKDFTGHTPAGFFAMESPERSLGAEEVY